MMTPSSSFPASLNTPIVTVSALEFIIISPSWLDELSFPPSLKSTAAVVVSSGVSTIRVSMMTPSSSFPTSTIVTVSALKVMVSPWPDESSFPPSIKSATASGVATSHKLVLELTLTLLPEDV